MRIPTFFDIPFWNSVKKINYRLISENFTVNLSFHWLLWTIFSVSDSTGSSWGVNAPIPAVIPEASLIVSHNSINRRFLHSNNFSIVGLQLDFTFCSGLNPMKLLPLPSYQIEATSLTKPALKRSFVFLSVNSGKSLFFFIYIRNYLNVLNISWCDAGKKMEGGWGLLFGFI